MIRLIENSMASRMEPTSVNLTATCPYFVEYENFRTMYYSRTSADV
jgi:hypothetical protein